MTQPNLLELAKQGDAQAIASIINYFLQPKGITAKVLFKDGCLQIMLESSQVPEQESSVTLIRKLIIKLNISFIKSVKIYGKKLAQSSAAWTDYFNLIPENNEIKKHSSILEATKQKKSRTLSQIWPIWFPYPSSWFWAIVLVPIAFPGTRLIVFGSFGVLISVWVNIPGLLIFSIFFGLLIPSFFLAFIYHICWFIWQKDKSNRKLAKWIPSLKSLWSGFYGTFVIGISFLIILTVFSELAFFDCKSYYKISEYFYSCAGYLTRGIAKEIFYSIETNNFLNKDWFIIWIITAAYLYQLELLARKRLLPQIKIFLRNFKQKNVRIQVAEY
ncbi:MAG: hypothetical protein PUP90_24735 [Nostoc sp. S4]|nr:hypothetical protein [Nostoc sp. S4]